MRRQQVIHHPGRGHVHALRPPVSPARVVSYIDFIEVWLRCPLPFRYTDRLKAAMNRPDGKRVWIQPGRRRRIIIYQPSVEEVKLLDSMIPADETDPVSRAELAYDFLGEREALQDFLRRSLAFK